MRLIVFDCDGKLVDSQHLIVSAMNAAFEARGRALPAPQNVRGVIGLSLDQAVARLALDADYEEVSLLAASYRDAFVALRDKAPDAEPLFPGAAATLRWLAGQSDVVLGIAKGKSRRGVHRFLKRFDLADCFALVQTADDAPSKPHPGMLELALSETGAEPSSSAMVGDTSYDMAMACRAGSHAIGVSWGYHPAEELSDAGADLLVEDFNQLQLALTEPLAPKDAA